MASNKTPKSFDSIIQAGRERKKAEQLASTIFGKGRRDSAPHINSRGKVASPSLASRITKSNHRSASSSAINRSKVESAFIKANRATNGAAGESLDAAKFGNRSVGKGFHIKGAAGPYVVVGSNFAPGTTSADIRSATEAIVGEMQSCVIITSNPTVIAEMVFADKDAAEMIISTFNNQKADGRLLHLYLKAGPPTRLEALPPVAVPNASTERSRIVDDRSDLFSQHSGGKEPRHTNAGMATPEYQDGRYGFDSKDEEVMDVEYQAGPEDNRRDARDDRYDQDSRSDRRGYRQDYARASNPRPSGYGSRGSRPRSDYRPQQPSRLYSDKMYSDSRGNGYDR